MTLENEPWGARPWTLVLQARSTSPPRVKRGREPWTTVVLCQCGAPLGLVSDRWNVPVRCFFLNETDSGLFRLDPDGVFRHDRTPPSNLVYGDGRFKIDRDRRRWPDAREPRTDILKAGPVEVRLHTADIPGKTGESPVFRTFFSKGAGGAIVKHWDAKGVKTGDILMPEVIDVACPRRHCGTINRIRLSELWRVDDRLFGRSEV